MLVKGHGLVGEGAPHTATGKEITRGWLRARAGDGHGKCSCGAVSEESLPSANARKRWHRDHKQRVVGGGN